MPESESADTGAGKAGGPAMPRKPKNPVTYAKGPAPDPNGSGSSPTGSQSDSGSSSPETKARPAQEGGPTPA